MADFSVATAKHGTLVATVVDRITLTSLPTYVRIINRGALGDIYVRLDTVDPTVGGSDSFVVQNGSEKVLPFPDPQGRPIARLISSGASPYSVEAA